MSTKRRILRRRTRTGNLRPDIVEAWNAADFTRLHRALGLKPWDSSPLPTEICGLGVDEEELPIGQDADEWKTFEQAIGWQRKLLAVAGWPAGARVAYEENLEDAKQTAAYYRDLIEHPENGGQGTGCDPECRRPSFAASRGQSPLSRTID